MCRQQTAANFKILLNLHMNLPIWLFTHFTCAHLCTIRWQRDSHLAAFTVEKSQASHARGLFAIVTLQDQVPRLGVHSSVNARARRQATRTSILAVIKQVMLLFWAVFSATRIYEETNPLPVHNIGNIWK